MEEDSNFWNRHSLKFLEMAYKTDHIERIANPHGYGERTGECGDSVEFFIMVDDRGKLDIISFLVNGCLHTTACCNAVVHLAKGLYLDQAWEISAEQVSDYLETLPEDHYHCAELSLGGFYLALTNYRNRLEQKGNSTGHQK